MDSNQQIQDLQSVMRWVRRRSQAPSPFPKGLRAKFDSLRLVDMMLQQAWVKKGDSRLFCPGGCFKGHAWLSSFYWGPLRPDIGQGEVTCVRAVQLQGFPVAEHISYLDGAIFQLNLPSPGPEDHRGCCG